MKIIEKRSNFKMQFIIIGIYLLLTMSGLILMKIGGNTGKFAFNNGDVNFEINMISLLGFICYIGSFFVYTRMIVMFDLSFITPICTGIVQILTLIASRVIFKESISIQGIIGASIIIIGLLIMNWKRG